MFFLIYFLFIPFKFVKIYFFFFLDKFCKLEKQVSMKISVIYKLFYCEKKKEKEWNIIFSLSIDKVKKQETKEFIVEVKSRKANNWLIALRKLSHYKQ